MILSKFHNLLGKLLVENRAGRATVCIDKSSFTHALEADGCVILEVSSADIELIPISDGDGFAETNRDGTERMRTCLVIRGSAEGKKGD